MVPHRAFHRSRVPQVGDWADHVSGDLDPRPVVKVDLKAGQIWIEIVGKVAGPLRQEDYHFYPSKQVSDA